MDRTLTKPKVIISMEILYTYYRIDESGYF